MSGAPGRLGTLWPTAAAVAVGVTLCVAPPGVAPAVRAALHDLAGPLLAALPPLPTTPTEEEHGEDAVASLAREIARLRIEKATSGDSSDRLVRPSWLTAETLGAATRRGETAALLIAAAGHPAAAEDADGLTGDLPAVDVGRDLQVRPGDLVVSGGAVVGRVAAAGRWTATVRPLTDPDFRLAVTLPGPGGRATAVLAGGADGPTLRHVPDAFPVAVGTVVSCDAGEAGGAAVPVGTIAAVETDPADGRRTVRVRPLGRLSETAGEPVFLVRAGLNRRRVDAEER